MLSFKNILWSIALVIAVYFCYLMTLITLQYIPYSLESAFLTLKTEEIKRSYYRVSFFIHVYSSLFVLIIGFIQFSKYLRNKFPKAHRLAGKAYIIMVLLLAAPSGLIMGIHGNGGIYSQISFCIQAVLWFTFTWLAYSYIKQGNISSHRNYTILSFSLTLSAISLRLFKWIIVGIWSLPPMDTYKIVVWIGWLFNLAIALLIILYHRSNYNRN